MATMIIEDNNPQAKQFVKYAHTLPSSAILNEPQKSFAQAAKECNAISVKEFFDEVRSQVNEHYDNHA